MLRGDLHMDRELFVRACFPDERATRPPVSLVVNLYPSENDLDLEQQDFQMPGSAYLVDRQLSLNVSTLMTVLCRVYEGHLRMPAPESSLRILPRKVRS